jgi:hypothetical protein
MTNTAIRDYYLKYNKKEINIEFINERINEINSNIDVNY